MRTVKAWLGKLAELRERLLDIEPYAMPAPRPDELFLCSLCVLSGIPTLLGVAPKSVDAVLSWPLAYAWAASLVLWPAVIIWTSMARWRDGSDQIKAAIIHRRASILLAATCLVYVLASTAYGGWGAAVTAVFVLGFAVVRLWRAYEMRRWLQRQVR